MKKIIALTASAFVLSSVAYAGDVEDKCTAEAEAAGMSDVGGGCTCLAENLSDDQAAAYLEITDWDSEATDDLLEVGEQCFPEYYE